MKYKIGDELNYELIKLDKKQETMNVELHEIIYIVDTLITKYNSKLRTKRKVYEILEKNPDRFPLAYYQLFKDTETLLKTSSA